LLEKLQQSTLDKLAKFFLEKIAFYKSTKNLYYIIH